MVSYRGGVIPIGDRSVGGGHPCFVIAEIGVNHNGDLELAHALIDAAVSAGADAVKFQTFVPELLAARGAPKAEYQKLRDSEVDQIAMLAKLALSEDAHRELQAHAVAAGIVFLSSPFDDHSVELLRRLDVPAYKIPSGEVVNLPMLRRIASIGRPILMSTGMCTLDEVAAAVDAVAGAPLALFHCVSSYPAAPQDCNLRAIATLRERFGVPVGWSDHAEGVSIAVAAVALGAQMIEKHITLDRALPGPDHAASLEPGELAAMVRSIRAVEDALGDGVKAPTAGELAIARVARKSLHWRCTRDAGHAIGADDLVALRPGSGLSPALAEALLGRRLSRAVAAGAMVSAEDLA